MACNQADEDSFAAAGRTKQGKAFTFFDIQVQVLQYLVLSVPLGDIFNFNNVFHST